MIQAVKMAGGLAIVEGCFKLGQFVGWTHAMMSVYSIGYDATKQSLGNVKGHPLRKAAYRAIKETLDSCEEIIPMLNGMLKKKMKDKN